jgi:hypothetical protein
MSAIRSGLPWSADDMAQLEWMLAQGCDTEHIATALGRTSQAVLARLWYLRRRADGQPAPPRKLNKRRTSGASFFLS